MTKRKDTADYYQPTFAKLWKFACLLQLTSTTYHDFSELNNFNIISKKEGYSKGHLPGNAI